MAAELGGSCEGGAILTTMKAADTREYLGLQMLRAIAALAVVAGHSTDYLKDKTGSVPWQLAWVHGPAGVDIFFIISGFVMMVSSGRLLEKAHPARLFLWRRLVRIVPLYWLLTAVRLAVVHARPQLSTHGVPGVWNTMASFLFIPSLSPGGIVRPVIPVGWTLSFEMVFYVVFALGMAWSGKLLRVVTTVIILLALVGVVRGAGWPVWTTLADPIVLEFLGGVWLGEMLLRGRILPRWAAWGAVGAGVLGLIAMVPDSALQRPLTWGVFALLIVGGTLSVEGSVGKRLPRWVLLLGDASYSIYLVQMFCFPPLHFALERWWPEGVRVHPAWVGVEMMGTSLVLTSLVALVVHRWVEKPMTEWLRQMTGAAKPLAVTP